jgi:hypothetical protein
LHNVLTLRSFQQTTIKEDTSKILRSSDNIYHDLNRLATNLNVKLAALETILKDRNKSSGTSTDIVSVKHLQRCVRTAATMVTSASTAIMGDEMRERDEESWDVASELEWLQDAFADHTDLTLNWVASQSAEHPVPNASLVRDNGTYNRLITSIDQTPPFSMVDPADRPVATLRERYRAIENVTDDSSSTDTGDEDQTTNIPINTEATLPKTSRKGRRNFSLSRLLSPRPKEVVETPNLSTSESRSLCMNNLLITESGQVRIKFTLVGDGACGKTCFLMYASPRTMTREIRNRADQL